MDGRGCCCCCGSLLEGAAVQRPGSEKRGWRGLMRLYTRLTATYEYGVPSPKTGLDWTRG